LVDALPSEQNDEWLIQRRYLSVESMALILTEPADAEPAKVEEVIARPPSRVSPRVRA
jgi:hypothetical protein